MIALAAAVLAGAGVYLVFTASALGWSGRGPDSAPRRRSGFAGLRRRVALWPAQAGLAEVPMTEFASVVAVLAVAFIGCYFLAPYIYNILMHPAVVALGEVHQGGNQQLLALHQT